MRLTRQRRPTKPHDTPPAEDAPPATLDLIYGEIKARLQEASAQNSALETKAGFVLGSASLLISGVTGAQAAIAGHTAKHALTYKGHFTLDFTAMDIMHLLTLVAAGIYLWVVWFAWRAYMVRKFKTLDPVVLYEYIAPQYEEWQVKKMLAHAMREQYTINQKKIDIKSRQAELALRGLLVEVMFLALVLVVLVVL